MKLIQLPTEAFEQRIKQELEENPALDNGKENAEKDDLFENEYDDSIDSETINTEDINIDEYISDDETPSYKLNANNYSADDEEKSIPYASGTTFTQHLINQLNTFRLNEQEYGIAEFLVGSITESGYIRREILDIVDDLAFTQALYTNDEEVERILTTIIHKLEPNGVGARDLQECLLIQLRNKNKTKDIENAIDLLDEGFSSFTKKHYKKLMKKFHVSEDELKDAIIEIEKLNPKPGGGYSGNNRITEHVVPDFTIKIIEDTLHLTLNGRNAPQLHVSREYSNMLKGYKVSKQKTRDQKDAVQFIKQKLDSAKWFIEAIIQRQQTLMLTMSSIMNYQQDYFLTGDETQLKPMILKDIADEIEMDISTVSRVANSKYVDTPYGTKLIKEFFSESMTNSDGEEVSTREIKKILENIVGSENKKKPLTDEKLAAHLKEKGYPIARRTVAKYREQLDIPVARLRKEI